MKLAELFVQFTAKGTEGLKAATAEVRSDLDKTAKSIHAGLEEAFGKEHAAPTMKEFAKDNPGNVSSGGIAGMLESILKPAGLALAGFAAAAAASFAAMAVSGIQNSAQWDAITLQLGLLSREFGSVFLPVVELVSDVLARMIPIAEMFTDMMQPAIQTLTDSFFKVLDAVSPLVKALVMTEAVWLSTILEVVSIVVDVFVPVIQVAANALKWFADTLRQVLNQIRSVFGLKDLTNVQKGSAARLGARTGGFEDVTAAYQRIAKLSLAASFGGKSREARQLEVAEQSLGVLGAIEGNTGRAEPAVTTR
jgi:hypothetical protein